MNEPEILSSGIEFRGFYSDDFVYLTHYKALQPIKLSWFCGQCRSRSDCTERAV